MAQPPVTPSSGPTPPGAREPARPAAPGGFGYHYGYGDSNQVADASLPRTRSLKDYLVLVRERLWLFVLVVSVVFGGTAVYTFQTTPEYRATATLQVLRREDRRTEFAPVVDTAILSDQDFNTQEQILRSGDMVRRVAERLSPSERARVLAPYERPALPFFRSRSVEEILFTKREVVPLRQTLVLAIQFTHADADIAALIANYFAEEYLNYNPSRRFLGSTRAVDQLSQQAEYYRQEVERIERRIAELKVQHGTTSFDTGQSPDHDALRQQRGSLLADKAARDRAEQNVRLMREFRSAGRDLWELPFIGGDALVANARERVTAAEAEVKRLAERYGPKHPLMQQTVAVRDQMRAELDRLVVTAASAVEAEFQRLDTYLADTQSRYDELQQRVQTLDAVLPVYNALVRDLAVNQSHFQNFSSRLIEATAEAKNDTATASIIDRAAPPVEPAFPNKVAWLMTGLTLGTVGGVVFVLALAFFDDKVKSSFDIESVVGLPILGIVPRLKGLSAEMRARLLADRTDRLAVEAFLALHSTLTVNDEFRRGKVLLCTSTVPGEGKSLVATNLAFTFAAHGERVVLIDCDLRMPSIAHSLNLGRPAGLVGVLTEGLPLDQAIRREVVPNCDVITAGGRARQPTPLFTSPRFQEVLAELRTRYDRIIVDSPPLAPVSDALTLAPYCDGVLYVLRFNNVRRNAARLHVRRLREAKVTVYGAVLNHLSTSVAGYYYSHYYYDRSYRSYYGEDMDAAVVADSGQPSPAPKSKS